MKIRAPETSSDLPTQRATGPGVIIPPPVIYLAVFLIGLAMHIAWPLPFLPRPTALSLGIALLAAGALFVVTSIPAMLRGHGTLSTNAPSAALVVSGPYRISRNPMYVALTLLYLGFACVFAIGWAIPLLAVPLLYTHYRVILPEERYLDAAFGDTYRAYRGHVRRWL